MPEKPTNRVADAGSCQTLRLVLGDQLDAAHHWFGHTDPDVLYLVAELGQEAQYVRHHVQKVAAFFLAMRAFAEQIARNGHRVLCLDLDETARFQDLPDLLSALVSITGARRFEYQRPDEFRLSAQLRQLQHALPVESRRVESEHFLLEYGDIARQFRPGKAHRMEAFYRRMRQRLGLMLDEQGEPLGGRWNFDAENRHRLPDGLDFPAPPEFGHDASMILARLARHGVETIGRIGDQGLDWPVTREESLQLLDHFCRAVLPQFGPYQDALSSRGWLLFHSRLSFSLNTKMLSPAEVVDAALAAARDNPDIPLASLEGFVRQVVGWREYMRAMYWINMPGYAQANFFGHDRALPGWYWSGDTGMACLRQAIGQSLDRAYAHHIQRLMVTGNFALLAGVNPDEVDAWYLGIYADAIEWVELPNTRGMSQYADGGRVASKPYISSGQYIQRMGDLCGQCRYRVQQKTGPGSCPFNSLYWHFLDRHRERLGDNPRLSMPYRNWDRMDAERQSLILQTARTCLEDIEHL